MGFQFNICVLVSDYISRPTRSPVPAESVMPKFSMPLLARAIAVVTLASVGTSICGENAAVQSNHTAVAGVGENAGASAIPSNTSAQAAADSASGTRDVEAALANSTFSLRGSVMSEAQYPHYHHGPNAGCPIGLVNCCGSHCVKALHCIGSCVR